MRTGAIAILAGILLVAAIACRGATPASPAPSAPGAPASPAQPAPNSPETAPSDPAAPAQPLPVAPEGTPPVPPTVVPPASPVPMPEPTDVPSVFEIVSGTVTYLEKIALGPGAMVIVKLVDVSRADAPATTIGEQIIENPGQVPIAFEIEYDPSEIDDRFTYAVQARIMEDEKLSFINDTAYQVITRGNPNSVDMVLVKVGPAPMAFDFSNPCISTLAARVPIEFEYVGTIPTGFDGINRATCTFTKPVETLTVTLTGPATHKEVFMLGEPTTEVSFPLPEGTLSITTAEIVPPGEYQREMTITSVDGETLVISDMAGVLKTITILEASN